MRRGSRGSGVEVDPERVKLARIAAGLSLAGLAGNDVSRTFIHLVEQGRARPSQRILDVIAERTGRPVSYFLPSGHSGPARAGAGDGADLAAAISSSASRVRSFMGQTKLNGLERESMRLVELSLRQAAVLMRMIEARAS